MKFPDTKCYYLTMGVAALGFLLGFTGSMFVIVLGVSGLGGYVLWRRA